MTFLQSSCEIFERDFLLEKAWEQFGYRSSNNSLGVAISELRKKFEVLGLSSQIITTIPKVGFSFHAEITVIDDDKTQTDSPSLPEGNSLVEQIESCHLAEKNANLVTRGGIKTKRSRIFLLIIGTCIITLILVFFILIQSSMTNSIPYAKSDEIFLYKDNKCNVFSLGNRKNESKENLTNIVKRDLNENNITCDKWDENIYHSRVFEDNDASSYSFIALCKIGTNMQASHCKTIIN